MINKEIELNMNILITSVGRRGYMVKYFKEVLSNTGKVHVSNSSKISPAFLYADKYVTTPLIYDDNYISFLKEYCVENEIQVIISLFDIDLFVLAQYKEEFASLGIQIIVSSADVIEICNDKWRTYNFLREHNFNVPKTYIDKEVALLDIKNKSLSFPLILKPRWGMGSISVFVADNELELNVFYDKINRQIEETYLKYESAKTKNHAVLIQEKLIGQEYGVDIINDLTGTFQNCIVKKKLAMRAGETDCAIVVENKQVFETGKCLSQLLQHVANLDVDMFVCADKVYILEMNARFGGGYPFSHIAGVNLPRTIINWVEKKEIEEEWLQAEPAVLAHKDIHIEKLNVNL